MATKELDPGQQHTFALAPLRVQLTGNFAGVVLRAVDQSGTESAQGTMRLTDFEMVLTPQPRRVRLVATPAGGSFAAGTTLGLMIRTEGANVAADQVMVAPSDVGALEAREIAILEFAEGRSVLSVVAAPGGGGPSVPPPPPNPVQNLASAQAAPVAPVATLPAPTYTSQAQELQGDDAALPWLQPGRYAFRDASKVAGGGPGPEAASASWGVVIDGSASMRRLREGGLGELVTLVSGIAVEWTHTWPGSAVTAGVEVVEVASALRDPDALLRAAYDDVEPSSWSSLAVATSRVLSRVGHQGCVLVITDGVPGDVDALAAVAAENPGARVAVVTVGRSALGLQSDGACDWWAEELAGLHALAVQPNVRVAAVQRREDGNLDLSGNRPAELALALTGPARTGASA